MTAPIIRIRSVGPAHASPLAELHSRAFAETGQADWSAASIAATLATPATTARLADVINGVALRDQTSSGFIICRFAGDTAEILTLCVDPKYQRLGLGSALIHSLASIFIGETGALYLEVAATNAKAISFYEKHGFSVQGRRPNYYETTTGRTDAILMARPFAQH